MELFRNFGNIFGILLLFQFCILLFRQKKRYEYVLRIPFPVMF